MTYSRKLCRPAFAMLLVAAAVAAPVAAVSQSMGPHTGRICPHPGAVFERPTPACGAATLHAGLFKVGLFQPVYVSHGMTCVRQDVFLRCK